MIEREAGVKQAENQSKVETELTKMIAKNDEAGVKQSETIRAETELTKKIAKNDDEITHKRALNELEVKKLNNYQKLNLKNSKISSMLLVFKL
jgi:hypothetical protein